MKRANIIFVIFATVLCVFTAESYSESAKVRRFSEVKITLDERFTLADAEALPMAPGNELEIFKGGKAVKVQIPAEKVQQLLTDSVNVEVERNFVLLERVDQLIDVDGGIVYAGSCSGSYHYAENEEDYFIEDNEYWWPSYIDLSFIPPSYTVTCIDVYYEVEPSWSFIDIGLTDDEELDSGNPFIYLLEDYVWGGGTIYGDEEGITDFNGDQLSQTWYLVAYEYSADGSGYIDYWWIKLYYEDTGGYCATAGGGYEYISNVQVGTINNSSGDNGYTDYTAISTEMQIGIGYSATITNGEPYYETDECGIWVDWNQDEDFDDTAETIAVSGNPGYGPYTATITPPPTAFTGSVRMRIRITDAEYDPLNPCGFTQFGEVEDYTVNVTAGGPTYGGGSGTDVDPYLIYTAEHLQTLGATPEHWDRYFKLMDNISLAGYTGTSFNIIGTSDTNAFTGGFDGNDHTISNFTYTTAGEDCIGLFGYAKGGLVSIKGLGLINPSINAGTGDNVGALVGMVSGVYEENFSIKDCYIEGGSVSGRNDVGGLIGRVDGYYGSVSDCRAGCNVSGTGSVGGLIGDKTCTLTDCSSSGNVSGTNQGIGGLVGRNFLGTVSDSSSSGNVTSDGGMIGGLAGINEDNLLRCYSTAAVTGTADKAGGLVGYNQDDITQCYSAGSVSGNDEVGGLVGYNGSSVLDCHAMGGVLGNSRVGGLVGYNYYATTENCYSTGNVTGNDFDGGLIGLNSSSTVTDSFWDKQTSGQPTSDGGAGKLTTEMYTESTFTNWDFSTPVWVVCEQEDYPKLYWDPAKYGGGSGTQQDPYLIFTSCQMNQIGQDSNDWDKHFKLMSDVNLSNYIWEEFNIIGDYLTQFTGVFNGNGKTISNFNYEIGSRTQGIGIFGVVGSNALIQNVSLLDPNINEISSSGTVIGSLVGQLSDATVLCCGVEGGAVRGHDHVGALVGYTNGGTISNCYASTAVEGYNNVGGLLGWLYNGAVVSECYSTGLVSGTADVGGLVGKNNVGVVENSFWDVDSSGQTEPGEGTGLPTGDMQDADTFIAAGWDFVHERTNGPNDIWRLCEGNYAKFAWRLNKHDFTCPDGVEEEDFIYLCNQWLMGKCYFDIAPDQGDGFVDFLDYSVFADSWLRETGQGGFNPACDVSPQGGDGKVDGQDAGVLMDEWLKAGWYYLDADIAPVDEPDGIVNFLDYAVFCAEWVTQIGP